MWNNRRNHSNSDSRLAANRRLSFGTPRIAYRETSDACSVADGSFASVIAQAIASPQPTPALSADRPWVVVAIAGKVGRAGEGLPIVRHSTNESNWASGDVGA